MGAADAGDSASVAVAPVAEAPAQRPQAVGAAEASGGQARARSAFTAEPQEPTGRFTTAVEVKPILQATQANWVAVRDWDGQDLLYMTHILAWRCGLKAAHVGINGAAPEAWPLPPCLEETNAPNAIPQDAVIYQRFPAGSIERVVVELTYDDLSTGRAEFERKMIQMP
ncbi:hypothetical protein J1C49_03000 [Cognatishimia sp. F0-27]|nr:hypothetical protein [Cognatishimia sp. F0-27]